MKNPLEILCHELDSTKFGDKCQAHLAPQELSTHSHSAYAYKNSEINPQHVVAEVDWNGTMEIKMIKSGITFI